MGSYRQTLLDDLTTLVTFLAREARVHSNHLMTSSCSLLFKDVEECAPTGVQDALSQAMVLDHVENLKLLNSNHLVLLAVLLGRFEMEITAPARNLEMGLRRATSSLAPSMTAFLASAQLTLLASQGFLRAAIVARVLNRVALTIGEKRRETDINTDSRMLARAGRMFGLWLRLTDDERVPVSIRPMHQMGGLGHALERTVHLDLERFPDLGGNMQVLVIRREPPIAAGAVLSELDGVPPVRFLETWKPHVRNAQLFGREKTLERFGETISQHLYGGGRHMPSTTPLELCGQIILRGKRALVLIVLLDGREHLVIELARLSQATHEQAGLFLIRVQSKLKCSHILFIARRREKCQRESTACGRAAFHPHV
jgi:hypothetical protein